MRAGKEHSRLARHEPTPPVRVVHLGLGAFSRSHTAWYTARASDAAEWGIAAYTGESRTLADALSAQDGVYSLVSRSRDGDRIETVDSIVRAHSGRDLRQLVSDLASPETAIVTLTITERGYRANTAGEPDLDDALVRADIAELATMSSRSELDGMGVQTMLGRLVVGLAERCRTGGGGIALVSCDNLPGNGELLRSCVLSLAAADAETEAWCRENVAFVSSSVDRITPRLEDGELRRLSQQLGDSVPVVTEPFSDWVISGRFPRGRPRWESAGARFVDDLEPWEARKLWMLNGAHTILAALGSLRGHRDVAGAIGDAVCRRAVESFWDEAQQHLPESLDAPAYRRALLARFENPRIVHLLAQVALDAETKVRLRIVPVARRERACGRPAAASARGIGAWITAVGGPADDQSIRGLVGRVAPDLALDVAFVTLVEQAVSGIVADSSE